MFGCPKGFLKAEPAGNQELRKPGGIHLDVLGLHKRVRQLRNRDVAMGRNSRKDEVLVRSKLAMPEAAARAWFNTARLAPELHQVHAKETDVLNRAAASWRECPHSTTATRRRRRIVTNLSRPPENIVAFYNQRGTCEQWIKEGKGAIKWTRLSCRSFAANAVRLQLHALAYNLGNFLRTLATPEPIKDWSLTSLKEKLIKIGAKVISHVRYIAFQMTEVAIPRQLFADILRLIAELRPPPDPEAA